MNTQEQPGGMPAYHNTFGSDAGLKITLFGGSHTPTLGVVVEGLPAGIDLHPDEFEPDLARRRSGALGTTPRREADVPRFSGGMLPCSDGSFVTSGEPLTITFDNGNIRPEDYNPFRTHPRPGHADFTASVKYDFATGGGIFSGRMTLPIVAAGVLAKRMIAPIRVSARVIEIGGEPVSDWDALYRALLRGGEGADPSQQRIIERLRAVAAEGNSLGGIVECVCSDMPVGLGDPFFDSLESLLAHAMFSIPGIRGVEFGDGFAAARKTGLEHNDRFLDATGRTASNGAGGINGGISNGNPVVLRIAVKPTATLSHPQETFDFAAGEIRTLSAPGRHDVCFALRVPPVAEALAAITLAQASICH